MYLKSFFLFFIFTGLSLNIFSQDKKVIWNGTGEATQTATLITTNTKGISKSIIEYTFKNVRYGSIVDRGSFYILTQTELNQFISDIEGALEKSEETGGYEWSRSNYTIKSGGNNSQKKGTFKIWVGEKHCPFKKKDALKLIKELKSVISSLNEPESDVKN